MTAGEVERPSPRKGIQQVQPIAVALFQLELQRVVIRAAAAPRNLDISEGSDRPARRKRTVRAGARAERRLVVVGQNLQVRSLVSNVCQVRNDLAGQLALESQEIALDVSRRKIFRDVARGHESGVEVGGSSQADRIALLSLPETLCLVLRVVHAQRCRRDWGSGRLLD